MVLYPPEIVFTSSHSRRMKSCRLMIMLGRYNFTKKYLWKNRPEDFRHPDAVFKNDLLGLVRKSFFKFRLISKIFWDTHYKTLLSIAGSQYVKEKDTELENIFPETSDKKGIRQKKEEGKRGKKGIRGP